jgi:hypothetical protein
VKRSILIGMVVAFAAIRAPAQTTIRVGAFPNITHAQAMVGKANGWFEKAMGPQVKVQWTSFNAGPSAIEALFGGAIDMTYVGPNPAINGPPYLFPTPWGVGEALFAGFQDHSYLIAIAVSMRRVLIGCGISVVLGMILGLGVASSKFLEDTMGGLLVSLQSLPSICWWPLALLWFGLLPLRDAGSTFPDFCQ